MGKVDNLLGSLDGVVRRGSGRWMAQCPAHADRSPSLSIRDLGHDRILFHCFGGCLADEILNAVGLDWQDVLPDSEHDGDPFRPARSAFDFETIMLGIDDQLWEAFFIIQAFAFEGKKEFTVDDRRKLIDLKVALEDALKKNYPSRAVHAKA